jgi:hypothetical protein
VADEIKIKIDEISLAPPASGVEAVLFTDQLMKEHPNIVSIVCGVISSYVYAFFTTSKKPKVHLDLVIEKTRTQTFVKVSFEGDVGDLQAVESAVRTALGDTLDEH